MFQLHNSYSSRATESKIARRGTLLHRSRTVLFRGVRLRPNRPVTLTEHQLVQWSKEIQPLEAQGLVFLQWKNKPILVRDALRAVEDTSYIPPRQSTIPTLSSTELGATHAKRIHVPPPPRTPIHTIPVVEDSTILALPADQPVVVLPPSLPSPSLDEFPDPPAFEENPPSDFTVSFKDAAVRVGVQVRQLKKRIKHWGVPVEGDFLREADLMTLTKEPPPTK